MSESARPGELIEILESPEEVLSTLTAEGKRRWVYPTRSKGRFDRRRLIVAWVLIALFVGLPLIKINGKPAILLHLATREFTFFGTTFYPTDTFLLLLILVGSVFSIILLTALLGRVWCGWGCPQTVYLEYVFRPIERWIEGPEHVRKRRNEGPWTFEKMWRKSARFGIYLIISLGLAHVFLAYFVGWDDLSSWLTRSPLEHSGSFFTMAFTTGLILFDFGYFREQMCTITCPYARMQSVLLDSDSLIVSYDPSRGEPRARRGKKKLALEAAGEIPAQGDCIDCAACVRTCPTGIDIRDGLQMECIACTQCVDACDVIMDNIGKPRGLIRYTSENEIAGKRARNFRPRTVIYLTIFAAIVVVLGALLATRSSFDINVGRVTGAPFVELPDGKIANRLRLRVRNQTGQPVAYTVAVQDPANAEVQFVGVSPVELEPGEMKRTEVFVLLPAAELPDGRRQTTLRFDFGDGVSETAEYTLLGPQR